MLRQWGRIGKIKAAHAPDVRFWSLADIGAVKRDVSFTPDMGHWFDRTAWRTS